MLTRTVEQRMKTMPFKEVFRCLMIHNVNAGDCMSNKKIYSERDDYNL